MADGRKITPQATRSRTVYVAIAAAKSKTEPIGRIGRWYSGENHD